LAPMPFLLSQGFLRYGLAKPFEDLWSILCMSKSPAQSAADLRRRRIFLTDDKPQLRMNVHLLRKRALY
jgi:hypothetical protein